MILIGYNYSEINKNYLDNYKNYCANLGSHVSIAIMPSELGMLHGMSMMYMSLKFESIFGTKSSLLHRSAPV